MIKPIINPFISGCLKYAVFVSNSKQEFIDAIQKTHESNCDDCHLFEFGMMDEKHKLIMPDNGFALWWATDHSPDEDDDEDINEYTNIDTEEDYDIPDAKRLYYDPSFQMQKFGDEYMLSIRLFEGNDEKELDRVNLYIAYKLIYGIFPQIDFKKDKTNTVKFPKKKDDENVH
jgi:hypothetical protein